MTSYSLLKKYLSFFSIIPLVTFHTIAIPTKVHAAIIADITNDWVDAVNPTNAGWTFKKNHSDLFTIWQTDHSNDGTMQGAWADQSDFASNAHVPWWLNREGTIQMHGAELDRTASDFTSATWTSDYTGEVQIDGTLWSPVVRGRNTGWQLLINDVLITDGQIISNGVYNSMNRLSLADGSGGASVLIQQISFGDEIELAFISLSENGNLGDTVEMDFKISTVPTVATVSEPSNKWISFVSVGILTLVKIRTYFSNKI